jgi:cytochrome P450
VISPFVSRLPAHDKIGLGFFYQSIKTWRAHKCLEWWEEIFARNGAAANGSYTAETYVMGGSRYIITAEPENVKAMLATNFASWGKGKDLYNAFRYFLGDGILTTDGEKWHAARGVMRPLFMRERVTELDLFERNVQRLMPMLGNGQPMEIDDLIFRYTLDAISEFLLGKGFGTLTDETNHFTDAFDKVQKTQSVIMRAG